MSELTSEGPLRFSRLLERVGVSQKSLTATLRGLERDGLVRRSITVQVPIRVDYAAPQLDSWLPTNQVQSMVNAGGLYRSLDSPHGEEISEQTTLAVKGL